MNKLALASALTAITASFGSTTWADCSAREFNGNENNVINAYVAFYGRVPDTGGLAFWTQELAGAGGDLSAIMAAFGTSEEFTERFGTLSNAELVNNLYQQLFSRDADSGGLTFYTELLDNNQLTLQEIALEILFGARAEDADNIDNRRLVGQHYVTRAENTGDELDADAMATIITSISDNTDTANLACDNIDVAFAELDNGSGEAITALSDVWIINDSNLRSTYLVDDSGQQILVNIEGVESTTINNQSYAKVSTSGIPNYLVTLSQENIDALNTRPKASSDFVSGATTAEAGDVIEFGADIGYRSQSNEGSCAQNAGYGYWPPGPVCPSDQNKTGYFPTQPTPASSDCDNGLSAIGYGINGTSIYNWGDGQSYNSEGVWQTLAPFAEVYDVDICGGHAAQGDYHHHFYSACWAETAGETRTGHSPVYGFAADGYPVYGPWHDSNVTAKSCWQKRDYSASSPTGCGVEGERSCLLVDSYDTTQGTTAASQNGPSTSGTYDSLSGNDFATVAGFFFEDYYFDSACTSQGEAYLDQYNGHDHDGLGYHYHLTVAGPDDLTPAFPFTFGPRYRGQLQDNAIASCSTGQPGGTPGGNGGNQPPDGQRPPQR
ncbi:MAG: DUF4214 domain-containing protein [Pseudomonadales bacterium]|nr:DUF4214 domain-containing protein [Pseudomonadales bacterium]